MSTMCQVSSVFILSYVQSEALRTFCILSSLAILYLFVFQMTIFLPLYCLDNKRIKNGKSDLLLCLKKRETKNTQSYFKPWFQKNFVPLIFTSPFKIVTVVISVCLITLGGMAMVEMPLGVNTQILIRDNTETGKYYQVRRDQGETGPIGFLVFANLNQTTTDDLVRI